MPLVVVCLSPRRWRLRLLFHFSEAGVSQEVYNEQEYYDNGGEWFFARTATEVGGYYGRLTKEFTYADTNVYSIWRYVGD